MRASRRARGVRGGAWIEFERRAMRYSRLDAQLCTRTRFFAAASLVNAQLAQVFRLMPSPRFSRGVQFLREAGAVLEVKNLVFAQDVVTGIDGMNDCELVLGEQAHLQHYINAHRSGSPQRWETVRRELNQLLNERFACALTQWLPGCGRLLKVLRAVRRRSGGELDFAGERHRVQIGLALIADIRACASVSAYGD